VVSSDAVDSLVIVHGVSWSKLHHYPKLGLRIHLPNLLAETEDVLLICVELEGGGIAAVVLHVEDFFLGVLDLYSSEVETVVRENKVISLSDT
jgi:hypothetical protein